MEQTNKDQKQESSGFMQWLTEDDSPEIGIATKEPLREYFQGVKTEFKKIEWPSKLQLQNEFFAVIIIVAIISALVFFIDLGIDKLIEGIKG